MRGGSTYELGHFVPFGAEIWAGLHEQLHAELWPLGPALALGAVVALGARMLHGEPE